MAIQHPLVWIDGIIQQLPTGDTVSGTGGVIDGDKGDITVSGSGTTWTIDNKAGSSAQAFATASLGVNGELTVAGSNGLRGCHGGGDVSTNLALGDATLLFNTTGHNNTASGYAALFYNSEGFRNTAYGFVSMYYNTSGSNNTAGGVAALYYNTSGSHNTAHGAGALRSNISGSNNTAIGSASLEFSEEHLNCTGIGANSAVTGNDQVQLGNSVTTTYVYGTVQNRSDARDKADIRDTILGLNFIMSLRPVDYKLDMRDNYRVAPPVEPVMMKPTDTSSSTYAAELLTYNTTYSVYSAQLSAFIEANKLANITHDGSNKRTRYHHGFIAQEVQATMAALGVDFGGFQDHKINGGDDVLSIGYDELIAPMVKAIQELTAEFEAYKATHP